MNIRPLTAADQPAWSALLSESFQRPPAQMTDLLTHLQRSNLVAWGAWDNGRLAAQYSCLLADLHLPQHHNHKPATVGISINMAVHPDYRGRGLVKQVAQPVYDQLTAQGVLAGVGFSNAAGVKVDRRSKGYGYQVLGQLVPLLAAVRARGTAVPLTLTDQLPTNFAPFPATTQITFTSTHTHLVNRYSNHPFRTYRFALWQEQNETYGVVVYRPIRLFGVHGVALLGAYSQDLPTLLQRYLHTLAAQKTSFIHCLTSPAAPLRHTLQALTTTVTPPYKRTPYYLTAKPLQPSLPVNFLHFSEWNCVGGDIR